jgi:hypothetical protein
MDTTVSHLPLNATQIHFLESLRFVNTDEMLQKLQQIVSDFYLQQLNKETDKWWEENNMTNEKMKEMLNSHYRTPYK